MSTITKTGVELIAEERQRQIEVEKFDVIHDQGYDTMQLSAAAGCYLASAQSKWVFENTHCEYENNTRFQIVLNREKKVWVDAWPWDPQWDKREKHDVKRSLQIAGALIAAELDRLISLEKQDL